MSKIKRLEDLFEFSKQVDNFLLLKEAVFLSNFNKKILENRKYK